MRMMAFHNVLTVQIMYYSVMEDGSCQFGGHVPCTWSWITDLASRWNCSTRRSQSYFNDVYRMCDLCMVSNMVQLARLCIIFRRTTCLSLKQLSRTFPTSWMTCGGARTAFVHAGSPQLPTSVQSLQPSLQPNAAAKGILQSYWNLHFQAYPCVQLLSDSMWTSWPCSSFEVPWLHLSASIAFPAFGSMSLHGHVGFALRGRTSLPSCP